MTTKLDKALKREMELNGVSYTVTISPAGLKIVEKGRRNGQELTWDQLVRGDVTMSQALADSIDTGKEEESVEEEETADQR